MFTCSFLKNDVRVKPHTAPGHSRVVLLWVLLRCYTDPVMTAKISALFLLTPPRIDRLSPHSGQEARHIVTW